MPAQEDIYFELQNSKASNRGEDSEPLGKKSRKTPDSQDNLESIPKKAGRPPTRREGQYKSTHIYFHPKIVEWAKAEAKRRGVGYQSVINETLLEHITSYITS